MQSFLSSISSNLLTQPAYIIGLLYGRSEKTCL